VGPSADVSGYSLARPPHPLWAAELRVKRAGVHIRSLERYLRRWGERVGADKSFWHVDEQTGRVRMRDYPVAVELGRSAVWIGDAVYNLRSALDYLVYNIACVCNDQRHVSGTQFLICDRADDFWAQATGKHPKTGKRAPNRMRHVPKTVINRFFDLQPCANPPCEWTRRLRDLSNPDKHAYMTPLMSRIGVRPGDHPDLDGLMPDEERKPDKFYVLAQVFFKDTGEDAVDTLKFLHGEVRALVQEFKPMFKAVPRIR
jgi:hypothetical protein